MSSYGPWSVKGIDDRAREVAKEQARLKGVTLGDYINELLLSGHSEAGPRDDKESAAPETGGASLEGLAQRIEAVEARSALAITGIDKSVAGLMSRLDDSDKTASELSGNMDRLATELRETHEALVRKVETLEKSGDAQDNLEAMKSLERALAKLASHVYEESSAQQDENDALRGRVEAGFEDVLDRLETAEARFEKRMKETAAELETLRAAPGGSLDNDKVEARIASVEDNVAAALSHMEGTLVTVHERLGRAEETTDTALKALEHTFASLNERIDAIANSAGAENGDRLRKEFEDRFEGLAEDVRRNVEQTREALASEISEAALGSDPQSFPVLEKRLNELSGEVQSRMDALSEREEGLLKTVSEQFNTLADQIDEQVASSERRSADAIEQVGEQVAGAMSRMQARQDKSAADLAETLAAFGEQQDRRLTEAVEQLGARVDDVQARASAAISPVQRAIATLAARLELIESGETGDARPLGELLPNMPGLDTPPSADALAQDDPDATAAEYAETPAQAELATAPPRATAEIPEELDPELYSEATSLPDGLEDTEDLYGVAASAPLEEQGLEDGFIAGLPDSGDVGMDGPLPTDDVDTREWNPEPADPHDPSAEPDDRTARIADAVRENENAEAAAAVERARTEAPSVGEDAFEDLEFDESELLDHDDGGDTGSAQSAQLADQDTEADPFDDLDEIPSLEERLADAAPAGDEVGDAPFEDEFGAGVTEFEDDPDQLFGAMDDGRDETRESDVFEAEAESDEDAVWDSDEFAPDDIVSLDPDSGENEASDAVEAGDVSDEAEETADYLNRARNAAIRATGDRSARFRAHQTGRGGVDRYSAKQTGTSPSRRPLMLALVLFGAVVLAAGAYVYLRTETLGTQSPFLLSTPDTAGPEAGVPAVEPEAAPAVSDRAEAAPAEAGTDIAEPEQAQAPATEPQPALAAEEARPVLTVPMALSVESAAENGNAIAQFQLGQARIEAGAITDGTRLVRAAAENNLPMAEYRLAKLHEEGLGVPRDLGEARYWTERAAEGGNANAMHDIAVFYAEGDGGLQSYAAAAKWFRKAADFGVVDSQYNLAILYENGLGISASNEEAFYWYIVAAANGDASAPGDVQRLAGNLDPAAVADIRQRAGSWTASTPDAAANGRFGEQSWQASQREQLMAVQEALNILGYEAGTPDGVMGPGTRTALEAFQADAGLTPNGEMSDPVVMSLNARLQARG